jgi:hypothetical protein
MTDLFATINPALWIYSNLLVAYIAIVLVIFVVGYYALFDPGATTAGKFVFRFAVSLIGVIGLVFISLFIDPRAGREWWVWPGDILPWRPLVRAIAYTYVAYTVTGLVILLGLRKWKPHLLRTAPDRDLVKVRNPKEHS